MIMSAIYENIVKRCKEHHISFHALEKELGIGNATIKGWETSSPRVKTIKKVADYFGCTIDDLLKEDA